MPFYSFPTSWRVPLQGQNTTLGLFSGGNAPDTISMPISDLPSGAREVRRCLREMDTFASVGTAASCPSVAGTGTRAEFEAGCESAAPELALSVGAAWLMFFKIPTVLGIAALVRRFKGKPLPVEERAKKTVARLPSYAFSAGEIEGLKRRYACLYAERPVKNADGTVSFGAATRFEREGLSVLHLRGDAFEMAFQHGALMREEIRRGVVPLMSRKIQNTIRYALGDASRFFGSASWLLNRFVHAPLLSRMPEASRSELLAVSEGAGIPLYQTLAAMTTYETIHVLAKYAIGDAKIASREACNCCSSFSVWGEKSGGPLVIGRNFDNAMNGYFDANPVVIYFEPQDGGQKYVSVTSAGVHTGGITAWNASGIFVAVHTVPTRETSPKAAMMLPVLTEVMRRAKTFDEAVRIVGSFQAAVGWAILLVSAAEKRSATIEMTRGKTAVRESLEGMHVQTNHFLHPEMKPRLMYVNGSADDDSRARLKRLGDIIGSAGTGFDARAAMSALADQTDPFNEIERGNENTVGVHTNMSSVVILPDEKRLFVANGLAPVAHNTFVEFPDPKSFDPKAFVTAHYETVSNERWKNDNPEMFEAVRTFVEAKKLYEYDKDVKGALAFLKKVVALDPENAAYLFNMAVMAAKLGDPATALAAFSDIIRIGYPAHKVALARYFRGRILAESRDSAGMARESLAAVAGDQGACPKLRAAAGKALGGLNRYGTLGFDAKKISLMMQQADTENY